MGLSTNDTISEQLKVHLKKIQRFIHKEILHSIAEASDEYETDLKLQCTVL